MNKIFIIAEAGVNHNGDIQTAKELIDVAAAAEADAVKFQTFKADTLVCRQAPKAAYQMETTSAEESQFDMLKKLELTPDMHRELIDYCHEKNIMFPVTFLLPVSSNWCKTNLLRKPEALTSKPV